MGDELSAAGRFRAVAASLNRVGSLKSRSRCLALAEISYLCPMRYFAELRYDGAAYCGWQRQPDQPTVQQTLEQALSTLLRTSVEVTGAGRTDTGVNASYYVAHFDVEKPLADPVQFTRTPVTTGLSNGITIEIKDGIDSTAVIRSERIK